MPKLKQRQPNRYEAIILRLFEDHYSKGITEFEFTRKEFIDIAIALGIELPSNVGDVIYNFRQVIEEKHYQLVSSGDISIEDLRNYGLWNRSDV